eukprot:GFUD01042643.1.p1 GENE.GFUD01042643.1~~GFUD01042643.1.p1  ORF type:complete len:241 (-),score=48.25 GFUD01042643.1:89-811(-)
MILRRLFPNKVTQTCLNSAVQCFPYSAQRQQLSIFCGAIHENLRRSVTFGGNSLESKPLFHQSKQQSSDSTSRLSWNQKSHYVWFLPVQTRWKDNDQYLHMNNSVYHAIFDSVINVYLIRNLGLDTLSTTTPRGYMVTNSCTFHGSAAYPDVYMAGLCVAKLGNSSVQYKLGLFPLVDPTESLYVDPVRGHDFTDPVMDMVEEEALVVGEYVHVFVDPETEKSTPISQDWRDGLAKLMVK